MSEISFRASRTTDQPPDHRESNLDHLSCPDDGIDDAHLSAKRSVPRRTTTATAIELVSRLDVLGLSCPLRNDSLSLTLGTSARQKRLHRMRVTKLILKGTPGSPL